MKVVCVKRTGSAFGDHMMAALFVSILIKAGIEAVYGAKYYRDLVDVPLSESEMRYEEFWFTYHFGDIEKPLFNCSRNIIETAVHRFNRQFGANVKWENSRSSQVPVKYYDIDRVPVVDVALCTRTGVWSKYREWPYFSELKEYFSDHCVNYIDLSESGVRDMECLNYVKKSRLFIGLETGLSHYVSSVVRKALILQSGYSRIDYWCFYSFYHVSWDVSCSCCFCNIKTTHKSCDSDHSCMTNISVKDVVKSINEIEPGIFNRRLENYPNSPLKNSPTEDKSNSSV